LLDEDLKYFFSRDELVWPFLKIIWRSEKLPPGLVVMMGDYPKNQRQEFTEVLKNMEKDKSGARLLQIMNSSGFDEIDANLLKKTIVKYGKKAP
jgi:ABC-type phosphate/phosphonate transport system substrate-binding protein